MFPVTSPTTLPKNPVVALKNAAYTPPAPTLIPELVTTLNCVLPVAVKVPLEAVIPPEGPSNVIVGVAMVEDPAAT